MYHSIASTINLIYILSRVTYVFMKQHQREYVSFNVKPLLVSIYLVLPFVLTIHGRIVNRRRTQKSPIILKLDPLLSLFQLFICPREFERKQTHVSLTQSATVKVPDTPRTIFEPYRLNSYSRVL